MYISSVEFVYEKLIETKRIELKRNHKIKRNKMKKKEPLVRVGNTNRDYRSQARCNAWGAI